MLAWRLARHASWSAPPVVLPGAVTTAPAAAAGSLFSQVAAYSKKAKKGAPAAATAADGGAEAVEFDLAPTRKGMEDVIKHLQKELASLRTGRATAGLLDHLRVELYGDHMPMKACGTATVRDPQLLVFNAFDPSTSETIAKAIRDSPLGLNPRVEGQDILVPVLRPTAESLKAMKKVCKQEGEQAKASIRHQRKVAMDLAKKAASEDDKFRHGKEVEALTQEFVAAIDSLVQAKERAIADHSA